MSANCIYSILFPTHFGEGKRTENILKSNSNLQCKSRTFKSIGPISSFVVELHFRERERGTKFWYQWLSDREVGDVVSSSGRVGGRDVIAEIDRRGIWEHERVIVGFFLLIGCWDIDARKTFERGEEGWSDACSEPTGHAVQCVRGPTRAALILHGSFAFFGIWWKIQRRSLWFWNCRGQSDICLFNCRPNFQVQLKKEG